jgi:hypothetical protein
MVNWEDTLYILTPEAYKSTGLTVWSNICIQFGAEQGILLNIFFNLKKAFWPLLVRSSRAWVKLPFKLSLLGLKYISFLLYADDLVLLSESQEGLQNCLNKTWEYCKS